VIGKQVVMGAAAPPIRKVNSHLKLIKNMQPAARRRESFFWTISLKFN